jgi:NADP-dependent 3-hydroxy acid dehydrogenase YdfG
MFCDDGQVSDYPKTIRYQTSAYRAIAFAIEQPADVDVNEIIIRPTAQG